MSPLEHPEYISKLSSKIQIKDIEPAEDIHPILEIDPNRDLMRIFQYCKQGDIDLEEIIDTDKIYHYFTQRFDLNHHLNGEVMKLLKAQSERQAKLKMLQAKLLELKYEKQEKSVDTDTTGFSIELNIHEEPPHSRNPEEYQPASNDKEYLNEFKDKFRNNKNNKLKHLNRQRLIANSLTFMSRI